MTRDSIRIGDRLYPVPRTLTAPGICYRTDPPRLTVTGYVDGGDVVVLVDAADIEHRISAQDLSRTPSAHRPSARRPTAKTPPNSPTFDELELW